MVISVGALLEHRGSIFMGRRKDLGEMGLRWELPGGKLEGDETPQEALIRELNEEMSLDIEVGELRGETFFIHKGTMHKLQVFSITVPQGIDLKRLEFREHIDYQWINPRELPLLKKEIVDSDWAVLASIFDLND